MKHTHIRFPKLTRLQRLVRPALAGPAPARAAISFAAPRPPQPAGTDRRPA